MNPRITKLRVIHRLETSAEMEEYDELIGELARVEPFDPALLPDLLLSFFDDTEGREVMWGLVHLVEAYPQEIYVPLLVGMLPQMVPQAHDWALVLLVGVLNNESCRPRLRAAWHALRPEEQATVFALFQELVQRDRSAELFVAEVTGP